MNTKIKEMKGTFFASLMTLACLIQPTNIIAAEDYFNQGIALFKSKQFAAAADKFEAAIQSGNDDAIVHYNLAVSYYKTENDAQAQQHFKIASKDTRLAAISYYNLGLLAERQGDKEMAQQWFERSHEKTADAALKTLAAQKLGLRTNTQKKETSHWSGFASASIGHDSNVAHVNDDLQLASGKSDNYLDLYASANYQLGGNYRNGEIIKIGGVFTDYTDLDAYDYSALNIGLYQSREINDWRSRYGAHLYREYLNGSRYQQRLNLQFRSDNKYAANQTFRAQYDLSLIDDLDINYSYLAGTRHRIKAQNTSRLGDSRIKLSYTLELNDREDLQQGSSFTSYSATRHTFDASLKLPISEKWTGRANLNYRMSTYNDAKLVSGVSQGTREDDRTRLTLRGIYHYDKNIEIEAMLRQTENDSNFNNYDYSSTISQLSLNIDF